MQKFKKEVIQVKNNDCKEVKENSEMGKRVKKVVNELQKLKEMSKEAELEIEWADDGTVSLIGVGIGGE